MFGFFIMIVSFVLFLLGVITEPDCSNLHVKAVCDTSGQIGDPVFIIGCVIGLILMFAEDL